jgi:FixJ family two-component response regulator
VSAIDRSLQQQEEKARQDSSTNEAKQKYASLTNRQKQVCDYLVQGLDNKTIAKNLGVTYDAIKLHKRIVLEKMQADSVVMLTRMLLS